MSIIAKPLFPGEPDVRIELAQKGVTGNALEQLLLDETVNGGPAHEGDGMVRRLWDAVSGFAVECLLEETRQPPLPETTTAVARLILMAEVGYHGIRRHAAVRSLAGPKRGRGASDWNAAMVAAVRWRFADRLLRLDPFTVQTPAVAPLLALSHNVKPLRPTQERAWVPNCILFPANGNRLLPRAWLRPLVLEGLRSSTGRPTRYRWPGLEFGGIASDWSLLANQLLDSAGSDGSPMTSTGGSSGLIIRPGS